MLTQTLTSAINIADAALTTPGTPACARHELSEYATTIGLRTLLNRIGTPLFVLDTGRIASNFAFFAALLPDAQRRYALAALPHPAAIRTIAAEGGGFDVVSTGELAMLAHEGVAASGAVYSHPIKRPNDIQAAFDAGVRRFVVDNPAEVRKFVHLASDVRLLVRLRFDQASAHAFGVDPEHAVNLVRFAAACGISVAGFSVHLPLLPNATAAASLIAELDDALAIGDILICPNFGAYSLVMSSKFEAIHRTRVHVLRRRTRTAVL